MDKGIYCKKGIYWYAYVDGREVYCGKGDKGQEMAEAAKAKEIAHKYEVKEFHAGLSVKRPQFRTFKQMCNWYMQLPSIQKQTGYKRKVYATARLLPYFGHRSIYDIERDDQEQYRAKRTADGVGGHTINYEIELLRAIYNRARKDKKIPADAMPGDFDFDKDCNNPRPLVKEDVFEKLLEHADPDFKDVLICGYESAMRAAEIANLTVSQVTLGPFDYIDLGVFDNKNKTRRTVPVSARLKEVLSRRIKGKAPDDPVFTRDGEKYNNRIIIHCMLTTCGQADILYGDKVFNDKGEKIGIVFHCLRGTRITRWIERGFSDEIIRRASGHKSLDAYRDYVKLGPQSVMMLVRSDFDKFPIKSLSKVA